MRWIWFVHNFWLAIVCLNLSAGAQQGPIWSQREYSPISRTEGGDATPSAGAQIGPFAFNFFCDASSGTNENLTLAITPALTLNGRWQKTYESGGFDGQVLARAGSLVVGEAISRTEPETGKVLMTFNARNYDFPRLVSGGDLRLEFEDTFGERAFTLNIGGSGLGASLCPIVTSCARNTDEICSIFTAIEGAVTDAVPLTDTLDKNGNPRWFKSEYQRPSSTLPYHSTASVVDPQSGAELHLSCLAKDSQSLALTFLRRDKTGTSPLFFRTENQGAPLELVWETGDFAGRWTQMDPFADGTGISREGIESGLMTRAILETLMTTNQPIAMSARRETEEVQAKFTPSGSRDAICAVMNGCDIPLGFSPACTVR